MLDQHKQQQIVKKEISPKINTHRLFQKQDLEKEQPDSLIPTPFVGELASDSQDQMSDAIESKKCV